MLLGDPHPRQWAARATAAPHVPGAPRSSRPVLPVLQWAQSGHGSGVHTRTRAVGPPQGASRGGSVNGAKIKCV